MDQNQQPTPANPSAGSQSGQPNPSGSQSNNQTGQTQGQTPPWMDFTPPAKNENSFLNDNTNANPFDTDLSDTNASKDVDFDVPWLEEEKSQPTNTTPATTDTVIPPKVEPQAQPTAPISQPQNPIAHKEEAGADSPWFDEEETEAVVKEKVNTPLETVNVQVSSGSTGSGSQTQNQDSFDIQLSKLFESFNIESKTLDDDIKKHEDTIKLERSQIDSLKKQKDGLVKKTQDLINKLSDFLITFNSKSITKNQTVGNRVDIASKKK